MQPLPIHFGFKLQLKQEIRKHIKPINLTDQTAAASSRRQTGTGGCWEGIPVLSCSVAVTVVVVAVVVVSVYCVCCCRCLSSCRADFFSFFVFFLSSFEPLDFLDFWPPHHDIQSLTTRKEAKQTTVTASLNPPSSRHPWGSVTV